MNPDPRDSRHLSHFIFVDDFVGSGNQFLDTINRQHEVDGRSISFKELSEDANYTIAYCPCISTRYAIDQKIKPELPNVQVHPAHILDHRHSLIDARCRTWSGLEEHEKQAMIARLKEISARAGFTREDEGEDDWRGFHKLALSVSFEHGIPDASLPIFYSTKNGWKPLMRRPE